MGPTFINGIYDEPESAAALYYYQGRETPGLGDAYGTVATVGKVAGTAGAISGGLASAGVLTGALAGSVIPGIGTIIGALAGILGGIFGAHAAKVQQENKISGQWAAAGPQTINQVVEQWQAGQIDSETASSALDSIYQQFLTMNSSITKYQGKTGAYPDPNAPRPSKDCNWACGTSYDLYQEIQGLKGQIGTAPLGASLGLGSLTSSPLLLIGGAALLLLMLKR